MFKLEEAENQTISFKELTITRTMILTPQFLPVEISFRCKNSKIYCYHCRASEWNKSKVRNGRSIPEMFTQKSPRTWKGLSKNAFSGQFKIYLRPLN